MQREQQDRLDGQGRLELQVWMDLQPIRVQRDPRGHKVFKDRLVYKDPLDRKDRKVCKDLQGLQSIQVQQVRWDERDQRVLLPRSRDLQDQLDVQDPRE